MNKLIKTIPQDKLSYEFLHSLNGIIGLTVRELEILSRFLDLHMSAIKNKTTKKAVDCTEHRRKIINEFRVSKENLSRYIKTYKEKQLFVKDRINNVTTFNSAIVPILIGGKTVQITMILKINENE